MKTITKYIRGLVLKLVSCLLLFSPLLQAACLDVFRTEPLPVEHPFWQHPAILLTPHISAVTNADTAGTAMTILPAAPRMAFITVKKRF